MLLMNQHERYFIYLCRSGTLAQSVQSACFTRKRSTVRICHAPPRDLAPSLNPATGGILNARPGSNPARPTSCNDWYDNHPPGFETRIIIILRVDAATLIFQQIIFFEPFPYTFMLCLIFGLNIFDYFLKFGFIS